ncbi:MULTISPECIES: DUF445 domain-containing protein [Romboutsia]|uniref:DUF445 family protein n=1 Tax=Romboutsia hominis TaxID=1507512 RepID=A0A2P2BUI4_9FIRM|nr:MULTISPECIES: DUF445 family protein [Romboutsia]MDB8789516.1 DUF445 family protein [Romboutsia sp. 1001216sp1]MDB8793874.1 DUF445 family protein [Romboutsia sp. 1001216sp1]MDB8796667.1 DUF445 family protein [Romboutsia sp. 1001216sp1]MDB8799872.1 DUF445 family protein [Romboutsia sp. 1001216sp1]MDB8802659.1 DUF445 family protein [Romboutsia sp. 1001216sp1]
MDNLLKVLILAIIGGVIGYITNIIAIKLIFRPINPIKIPIINTEIIGIIPKRRSEIATNIGEIIQDEFLSIDEILNQVITDEDKDKIAEYIQIKIKSILNEKMSFAPSSIKNLIQSYVSDMIEEEIKNSIDDLSSEMINKASKRINIQQMIEDKINELDLYELEEIILKVAKNELKHIEILGFVLGFAIGIVQGIIIVIL